jgi:hypothetical protein
MDRGRTAGFDPSETFELAEGNGWSGVKGGHPSIEREFLGNVHVLPDLHRLREGAKAVNDA